MPCLARTPRSYGTPAANKNLTTSRSSWWKPWCLPTQTFLSAFCWKQILLGGLAVVLAQEQDGPSIHPLAYASRSLLKHEQNYGMTELEALAVVWGVKTLPSLLVWSSV